MELILADQVEAEVLLLFQQLHLLVVEAVVVTTTHPLEISDLAVEEEDFLLVLMVLEITPLYPLQWDMMED